MRVILVLPVSEGLNSVETAMFLDASESHPLEFQKDLIVWKRKGQAADCR